MNDIQRARIGDLRRSGMSFREIAEDTGISINTVKSYCLRLKIEPLSKGNKPDKTRCLNCGKLIIQYPGRKLMKYCCKECRTHYTSLHRNESSTAHLRNFKCANCGKPFRAYGTARKYCCYECYIADRFKGGNHAAEER